MRDFLSDVNPGGDAMKLRKDVFILIVTLLLVFYGAANAVLWHKHHGFHYVEKDLFLMITSAFLFMIVLVLPRTVLIMLGGESMEPERRPDTGDTSRCQQSQ